jgi:hypothetical protein
MDERQVALLVRPAQRRRALLGIDGLEVRAAIDQQVHRVLLPVHRGVVQWRRAAVHRARERRILIEQRGGRRQVAVGDGLDERGDVAHRGMVTPDFGLQTTGTDYGWRG